MSPINTRVLQACMLILPLQHHTLSAVACAREGGSRDTVMLSLHTTALGKQPLGGSRSDEYVAQTIAFLAVFDVHTVLLGRDGPLTLKLVFSYSLRSTLSS